MYKVSYVLAKRFSQDLTFANNILLEKINYPSVTLVIPKLFETKKYSSQQQQVKQDMKIWSQIEPVQCQKKYKQQSLLSSKVSNSHYIGT